MRRVAALSLAVLVVLSGCSVSMPSPESSTPTWSGDADNPFRESTLTVVISNEANASRDFRPQVRAALDYWEANAEQYAGYPIEYELVENASNPDLRIRFVETIADCGSEGHTAGCAPIIESAGQVDRPVQVRVRDGFSDASTVAVLKHELGHTLGIEHGQPPREVMQEKSNLTTLPQPNATDRALPWDAPELSVYVDLGAVPEEDRDATNRQVNAALGYFAKGAEGSVPENVSFTRIENRSSADVVVAFTEQAPCTPGAGSCGSLNGRDPDGDGAIETYTRLHVTISGVDTEAVAWHVGYWLAKGFGLTGSEIPAPLRSDDPQVRRSQWWR